jgi:hypothetical protein
LPWNANACYDRTKKTPLGQQTSVLVVSFDFNISEYDAAGQGNVPVLAHFSPKTRAASLYLKRPGILISCVWRQGMFPLHTVILSMVHKDGPIFHHP